MTPIKAKRIAESVATASLDDLLAAEVALENLRNLEVMDAHRRICDEIERRERLA